MNEIIEIKRKEFEVIEQMGDRSYKAERKGNLYFIKKFDNDAKGFEEFVDAEHKLRVSGVVNPKCLIYDKKARIAAVEFIEGDTCLEALLHPAPPRDHPLAAVSRAAFHRLLPLVRIGMAVPPGARSVSAQR